MKIGIRTWILIITLILMVVAISPHPNADGVVITSVETGSPAVQAGIVGPSSTTQPVQREVVLRFQGIEITSVEQFNQLNQNLSGFVQLQTDKNSYAIDIPNSTNTTGVAVGQAPTSNIRKGLDLTGGARVLVQPVEEVDDNIMELLITNIEERLNIFGLSDVTVRDTQDFSGNQFILVEIAGADEQAIVELLTSQGEFEAKIGNKTVFTGGEDVTYVGTSAQDSGIRQCSPGSGAYVCQFFFAISLSTEAANRHADITRNLEVIPAQDGGYLSETLDLFLDGENITSLQISAGLRGSTTTQIQISGSEQGGTQEAAARAAQEEMKRLQTVLATGSLPVKLEVVKTDSISAELGASFINNILLVGLLAILAVIITVSTRYKDFKIAIPMSIAMLSEVVIILGIAALFRYNLYLAGIEGILIAIGTGVDDQIIIVDEIKSEGNRGGSWKQRMKRAFFIIFAAFFTLIAAMLPLMWAGAGLVRGFAIMTIVGVSAGVFVTRPAFAELAKKFVKYEE
jgi:preprotein translocase subunit SecD